MIHTDVLIAGAGPVGLTAAIELARRGIDFRIIDPVIEPPQYAKAVGVQPRTLGVFEGMGVLGNILDAAVQMFGQVVYVNGEKVAQIEFATPAAVRRSAQACRPRRRPTCGSFAAGRLRLEGGVAG